jgi:hypothetical protein
MVELRGVWFIFGWLGLDRKGEIKMKSVLCCNINIPRRCCDSLAFVSLARSLIYSGQEMAAYETSPDLLNRVYSNPLQVARYSASEYNTQNPTLAQL